MEPKFSQHPLSLLVSIEAQHRSLLETQLQNSSSPLQPRIAEDHEEFSHLLNVEHFDCILFEMPQNGGSEESLALLSGIIERARSTPVIVWGTARDSREAVEVMRLGAADYLSTAEEIRETLVASIRSCVQRAHQDQQLDAAGAAREVAEKVLRERELQIRGFFDFASVSMALVAPSGKIVRANPALRRLCGYSLEEISGLTISQLLLSEDRATVKEGLSLLVSRQIPVCDDEVQFRHKSGEGVWVSATFAVITNEDGEVQGYTLQATDIRTRKATEAQLLRSERRFQELLAQAPIGIFETDALGACRYINERWTELTGQLPHAAMGTGWLDALHPDSRKQALTEWAALMREGREFSSEFRLLSEAGSVVWGSVQAGVTRDHEGGVIGYLGTLTDITVRRLAVEELENTSILLRSILDSAPYSVIATSKEGIIREFSRGAEKLLGYQANEVLGQTVHELLHVREELMSRSRELDLERKESDGVDHFLRVLLEGAKSKTAERGEWTYIGKDGEHMPVELAVSEMVGPDQRLTGYLVVGSDITERRRRNQELISAKDAAERATAAKADFLAKMSHEIRTPMNSVLGMTEMVLQTTLTREQRSYLLAVQRSGQSLLYLINDILDFSRGEARRLTLENVAFDLYDTLATCLRGPAHIAREKGIELILRMASDAPQRVLGDPYRLQQILVNLVSNAVKFTPEGEVLVDIACGSSATNEPVTLYLNVVDSGPGVEKSEQEKIFGAFTQEDTGIARRFGGTGLGLAICSQLVDLMGGEIWLESEPGQGSSFHVTVALRGVDVPAPDSVFGGAWSNDRQVLVMEPNAKSLDVTRSMVNRAGFSAVCAEEQQDALEYARKLKLEGGAFAVAILDFYSWDRRAQKFIAQLEALNGPLGVICLSPAAHRASESWAEDLVFLSKPILPEELNEALQEAMSPLSKRSRLVKPSEGIEALRSRPLRILVAEDNETNQQVVSLMLERLGHQAELVENGLMALDRLSERSFDLVLMDLQMPVMGGQEAVRLLREQEKSTGRHLPVVALTAQAMRGDKEDCLLAGMDDYLCKPLDLNSLAHVLDAHTDSVSLSRATPSSTPPGRDTQGKEGYVDFTALRRRIGDTPQIFAKISTLFERDTQVLLAQLESQIAAAGAPMKGAEAHTLKGTLRNVCANGAAEQAAELEHSTGDGDWAKARAQIIVLRQMVTEVVRELQSFSEVPASRSEAKRSPKARLPSKMS